MGGVQVFNVTLDNRRSRRFPVTVLLYNLRPVHYITDTETLAEHLSRTIQEKVDAFSRRSIAYGDESQWPPLAVVSICRADKSSMRMSLRSSLVVGMLLNELKQLGWPPDPVDAVDKQTAPAGSQSCEPTSVIPDRVQPAGHTFHDTISLRRACLKVFQSRLAQTAQLPVAMRYGSQQSESELAPTNVPHVSDLTMQRQAIRRSLQRAGVVPTDMEWLEHVAVRLMYTGHPAENKYVILKVVACVI
eukprot:jgi/Chrzof1/10038/Cz04g24290.t1